MWIYKKLWYNYYIRSSEFSNILFSFSDVFLYNFDFFLYIFPRCVLRWFYPPSCLLPLSSSIHLDGDREPPLLQETEKLLVQSFLLNSTRVPFVRTLSSFYQQSITIVWELQVFVAYIRNVVRASEAFVESRGNCGHSWDSIRYKKENGKRIYSPASGSDISYFYNGESTNIFRLFFYDYKLLSNQTVRQKVRHSILTH